MSEDNIQIKLIGPDDVTEKYVRWMNDENVVQFLESRWQTYTIEDLRDYVRNIVRNPNDFLFGIFLENDGNHIGNIKIGNVNKIHRFGSLGLIIGERDAWGKGYGTEAIRHATSYAFNNLNLNKLIAGIYLNNIGSTRAFKKAGFREIGVLKNHRFCNGSYVDEILLEKINNSDNES